MPTEPTGASVAMLHQARRIAESFGTDPVRYDRARARYPDEILARIVALAPGPSLLDVGAGTGIASRQLQRLGATVLGVEPDARMGGFARDRGTEVEVATFEDWNAAGRTFDGLISATAWHWVDPVAGARKAADVLRPGGLFAAIWNVAELPADLSVDVGRVYARIAPDALGAGAVSAGGSMIDAYGAIPDKAAGGLQAADAFGEPDRWRVDWDQRYTRDEWLDLLPTQGGMTSMPSDQRRRLLAGLADVVDQHGGAFTMHYGTLALIAHRRHRR